MKNTYKMGEIYWFNLNGTGNVQTGWHPGVIVQNNIGNKYSNTIAIVPITSKHDKTKLPTHVEVRAGKFGLPKHSVIQCEGQRLVDKCQMGDYIGKVDDKTMNKIAKACLINTPYLLFLTIFDIESIQGYKDELKIRYVA